MFDTLSIEDKAKLFDEVVKLLGKYVKGPPETEKPKKEPQKINIPFEAFREGYKKKEGNKPGTIKKRYSLTDKERETIMEVLPEYVKSKVTLKDGNKFQPFPITFLNGRRWEEIRTDGIDYRDLNVFHALMKDGKMDILKEKLGTDYIEVKRNRQNSPLYLGQ